MSIKRFLSILAGEPKNESSSAKTAKERLQIVIAKDMSEKTLNSQLVRQLQAELLELVKKYVHVNEEDIEVEVAYENGKEILGLNITFPDEIKKKK